MKLPHIKDSKQDRSIIADVRLYVNGYDIMKCDYYRAEGIDQ